MATLDGAVLKSRSPSCGLGDTKVYSDADTDEPIGLGHGLFARSVQGALGGLALSDEALLGDPTHRRAFLERLFALASLRDATEPRPGLVPRLRHLLAQDAVRHRETLEVAMARTASPSVREAISEALSLGPANAEHPDPLYPPGLD